MDYFMEFTEQVTGRDIRKPEYVQAKAEDLPFPDGSFDIVSCTYCECCVPACPPPSCTCLWGKARLMQMTENVCVAASLRQTSVILLCSCIPRDCDAPVRRKFDRGASCTASVYQCSRCRAVARGIPMCVRKIIAKEKFLARLTPTRALLLAVVHEIPMRTRKEA